MPRAKVGLRLSVAIPAAAAVLAGGAGAALACGPQAELRFAEGAPDSFEILNRSPAGWEILEVVLELRGSAGEVYFDPTGAGAGASMPDPFVPQGPSRGDGVRLRAAGPPQDGDTLLVLAFDGFAAGAGYLFTIDTDDRAGSPPHAVVEPEEIAGAQVRVRFAHGGHEVTAGGRFDTSGIARTADRAACG